MGGLQRIFLRITPIIMLICFICFGITHTFGATDTDNNAITYLTTETITINDNNTPNDTTDDITIQNYKFDFKSYTDTISNNTILKTSLLNTIDLETFKDNIRKYNTLWEDGYQFLDISKSILNTFVLLINGFLTITNVIIAPFRLAGAIFLTGMSLIGININRNKGIIKLLKTISLYAVIPLIGSAAEKPDDKLTGTTWYWQDNIPTNTNLKINVSFVSNNNWYNQIIFSYQYMGSIQQINYHNTITGDGASVYSNTWVENEPFRKLTLLNNDFTNEQCIEIKNKLQTYSTQMIDNTIWQFNDNLYNPYTNVYTFNFNSYETQGNYIKIIIQANNGIWYEDTDNNQIKVYDSQTNTWIYEDSKTIKIKPDNYTIEQSNTIWSFLITYGTKISF